VCVRSKSYMYVYNQLLRPSVRV